MPTPIIYASAHYTHSAHVPRQQQQHELPQPDPIQRPSSVPLQSDRPTAESILEHYGVNPKTLNGPQLELFKSVDDDSKLRLLECWRVAPPNPNDDHSVAWQITTVEREAFLAQMRYERRLALDEEERQQKQQQQQQQEIMSLDGTPLTPVQTGDGRWISVETVSYVEPEPYMMSGYEELARREYEQSALAAAAIDRGQQTKEVYSHFGSAVAGGYRSSTDPVYNQDQQGDEWTRQQQAMEDQYGAFQAGMEFEP